MIAHGTANARWHAAELLFQYLPSLNPALLDRKGIGNKPNGVFFWVYAYLCPGHVFVVIVSFVAFHLTSFVKVFLFYFKIIFLLCKFYSYSSECINPSFIADVFNVHAYSVIYNKMLIIWFLLNL